MLKEIVLGLCTLSAANICASGKDSIQISADTTQNQNSIGISECRDDIEMGIASLTHFVNKSEYIKEKIPLKLFFTEDLREGLRLFQIGYKGDSGKDIGLEGYFGIKTLNALQDYYDNRSDRAGEMPYDALKKFLENIKIDDTSTIPLHRMTSPEEIDNYCNN